MSSLPPTVPRTRGWGIGLALSTAVISGFAVYMNGFALRSWIDAGASAAVYTTAKNLVAAVLLGGALLVATRRRRDARSAVPTGRHRLGLTVVALVGGSLPFLLFFEGLSRAASTSAGFIHKTLVVWVVVLAIPILGERVGWGHVGALALLMWGHLAISGADLAVGAGEAMILAATLLWATEVVVAKRLLVDLSPLTVGAARMAGGGAVLVGYLAVSGDVSGFGTMGWEQWTWALVTGAVLTGYVGTWFAGLARAPAVDVTAVLVVGAVITAGLESGFGLAGPVSHPAGLGLLVLGAAAFVAASRRRGADERGFPRGTVA